MQTVYCEEPSNVSIEEPTLESRKTDIEGSATPALPEQDNAMLGTTQTTLVSADATREVTEDLRLQVTEDAANSENPPLEVIG